ncbi:MAG TPA: epoxyqueuosine reductase QueH [Dehalococcoidia bacterium]|nr:epoxyqueuosine reductase QueH [Dehalococcoidia bacterium]
MKIGSVLVHCCCAHCTAYTIEHWRRQGYKVASLWYNPNVHPYMEHQRRLEAMHSLAKNLEFPLITIEGYDIVDYFRRVVGDEVNRCRHCFNIRLSKTAESALRMGYDAFTTSLLISHQQKHSLLQEVGDNIAREKGIEFLYADLRKRYSDSRHITKPMDLYRQQYCGCVYSEWERYSDVKIE